MRRSMSRWKSGSGRTEMPLRYESCARLAGKFTLGRHGRAAYQQWNHRYVPLQRSLDLDATKSFVSSTRRRPVAFRNWEGGQEGAGERTAGAGEGEGAADAAHEACARVISTLNGCPGLEGCSP